MAGYHRRFVQKGSFPLPKVQEFRGCSCPPPANAGAEQEESRRRAGEEQELRRVLYNGKEGKVEKNEDI
jgi:hypothetical protein